MTGALGFRRMELDLFPKLWIFLEGLEGCRHSAEASWDQSIKNIFLRPRQRARLIPLARHCSLPEVNGHARQIPSPCVSLTLPAGLLELAAQSEPPVGLEASLMVLSGCSFFSFAGALETVLRERRDTTGSVAYKESRSNDLHIMGPSFKTKRKKGTTRGSPLGSASQTLLWCLTSQ